jgi:uncharacterized membrane protein
MRSISRLLRWLGFCLLALVTGPTGAGSPEASSAEVRALLFYSPTCVQCADMFAFYLPLLFERYGKRLEVAGINVSDAAGITAYRAVAARFGLAPEWAAVPTVVVSGKVAVGPDAIAAMLGDDFEVLAAHPDSSRWPAVPGLDELVPEGLRTVHARVTEEGAPTLAGISRSSASGELSEGDRVANQLAIAVLIAMVLALVHSMLRMWRADTRPGPPPPSSLVAALVLGLGISAYTAYTSLADVAPVCGSTGGCGAVQQSDYAKLFGIPMGVLGVLGYASILVTWLVARHLSPQGGGWRWLPWAIALFGVAFSIHLTALEPFVIGHTCLWCLGSAISMTAVLWLLSGETRRSRTRQRAPH